MRGRCGCVVRSRVPAFSRSCVPIVNAPDVIPWCVPLVSYLMRSPCEFL